MKLASLQPLNLEAQHIESAKKGDLTHFGKLVAHYQNWILGHLLRWNPDILWAQEATQEVFLKAFRGIKDFRGEAKFSSWIFTIAWNLWRDKQRKKSFHRRKKAWLESHSEEQNFQNSAETNLLERQEGQILRESLKRLPMKYQEALSLRYLSELSYEQISAQLQQSIGSIKMRVVRGLKMLQKELKGKINEIQ